jgi:nucleotide-binding universal stress UspA family protein
MSGIIVGVDGSGHSDRALSWAAREAALRQVPLTVLFVHQAVVGYAGTAVYLPEDDTTATEHTRNLAQEQASKILAGLDAAPPQVSVQSVNGVPAEELVNAAKDADLLVVGSRGAGGFSRLLMGSVSTQVTHHAQCPVVVVPGDGRG